jgi:DNA-binding NarL/FixJ family response regulator
MSRVLIADDHAVVRAGYKQFLESDPSITEVGEAASGDETLDALRRRICYSWTSTCRIAAVSTS